MLNDIIGVLEDIQAQEIVIYDMRELSPFYEYSIICSGKTDRQTNAIYERLSQYASNNELNIKVEGKDSARWILVDLGSIIVNVFVPDERDYFKLEKLWMGVPQVQVDDVRNV